MDTLPEPVPYPQLTAPAMIAVLLAGLTTATCGLQLLVFVALPNAIGWAPAVLVALGATLVGLTAPVSDVRFRPILAALALSGIGSAVVGGLAVYLLVEGVFVLLFFLAPVFLAVAALLLLLMTPSARRYSVAQAALLAEVRGESLFHQGPPPASPWVKAGAALAAILLLGWIPLSIMAPVAFERALMRAQLLGHAQWPTAADAFTTTRVDFPYAESPFLAYVAYESRFVDMDAAGVGRFADQIAEDVGWRMRLESGARSITDAEVALWNAGRGRDIPLWIADALRSRGVFYHLESLLSRSFDPWLHSGDAEIHMDCDQLVHLFTHVGWRLDLGMDEIQSPMHAYLGYRPPHGVDAAPMWVETTAFRRVDVSGRRVDYMGRTIGDDFFIPEDYHSSGKSGIRASARIIEAAGFYTPSTERDVQDSIVGNVLAGLEDSGLEDSGLEDAHAAAPVRQEMEAHVEGTRSYLIVSNLRRLLVESATKALEAGNVDVALADAREAAALRERFPGLVVEPEPIEWALVARSMAAKGEDASALTHSIRTWYAENAWVGSPPSALSANHVEALLVLGAVDGTPTLAACDETYGAILRYDTKFDQVPWQARLCTQLAGAPACAPLLSVSGCS